MNKNIWLIAAVLLLLLLGINNTVYYFYTKKSLEDSLSHELLSVAKQIELSVEQSRLGAERFEEQIGRELRAAAIAAQYALDPDVELVTNEQLMELARKLDVLHITLLKQTEDNIVLYRSSDPREIGIKTGTWRPWHQAFRQLFEEHNVSIDWGQTLPNFWTGPYDYATSDTSKLRKWGYYYDGSTNYIIDPYVSYEALQDYEENTGVERLIRKTLEENTSLLEITGINPVIYETGAIQTITFSGETLDHETQKPIIFGTYNYKTAKDRKAIKKAYETGTSVTVDGRVNGVHVMKSFIPVDIDKVTSILDDKGQPINRYVLTIVSDYQVIQSKLDRQFTGIGLVIGGLTLLSIAIVWISMRLLQRSRERVAAEAQRTYVEEINQMFNMIRAQRHDFLNHVQTIHSLV
ncbi:Spo0B domain-containing protein [Paenibacillus tarimensis]|uniref:Spo0B domain-containing protein n=1 Tax=Paenibacillus tarimensis TaxID=416012 RepID=UPI001F3722D3|nr:Spo0B domain-containing protein [Paenibacillus tarimensis]MCF2943054.1 Spo0B domain-containing protein [Paenibacillus tarimensis]